MAMMRYANAAVLHPGYVGEQGVNAWDKVRTAARRNGNVSVNLIEQASEIFEDQFDPSKFLLTHATIVASVDVFEPPGTKRGSVIDNGFRVNRKYGDYRIKSGCDKFINNNQDAWSRGVLVKSYRTFVGAHNFVEHVQIEDLSKGRIIDSAARDIGDSVYVDILIATAREHTDLIKAIESGKLATLSMGCTVDGTVCTKCGHWAADETEMCPHVKYEKGNTFFDGNGHRHRVAELCGHESLEPTGGVQFIEGSWVGTPAFTGAVMRNILEPSLGLARRAQEILSVPPPQWDAEVRQKASFVFDDTLMAGPWDDEEEEEGAGDDTGGGDDPLKSLEDDLTTHMMDRVKKRLKEEMSGGAMQDVLGPETPTTDNDTLIKQGSMKRTTARIYRAGLGSLVRTAASDAHLMDGVAALNQGIGVHIPVQVYRVALKVGPSDRYTMPNFLRACRNALGRQPSLAESKTMMRLGKLLSERGRWSPLHREIPYPGSSQGVQQ